MNLGHLSPEEKRLRKNELERNRKANRTEERKKADNAKNLETKRTRNVTMPYLEKRAERIRDREIQQRYRATQTKEERMESNEKERKRRVILRENMTEEELKAYHAKDSQAALERRADKRLIKKTILEILGGQGIHNQVFDEKTEHELDVAVAQELNRKFTERMENYNDSNNN